MWHGTRYKAWPLVEEFIQSLEQSGGPPLIADVGCGNGKNLPACNQVGFGIGSDFSTQLVRICRANHLEALCADCLCLPYRTSCFDAAICIAVLHHISTIERRKKLIFEALRVIKVGGKALFYAWAFEQDNSSASGHRFETQDVLVPWHVRQDQGLTLKVQHAQFSEEKQALVYQRYCHVYRQGELQELADSLQNSETWLKVERVYYDTGNWCMVVVKTSNNE